MSPALRAAPLDEVPPRTLYAVLRLRVDVFVVEQDCPYPELDGRDAEPGALLLWAEAEAEAEDGAEDRAGAGAEAGAGDGAGEGRGAVLGTARLLREPGGRARIGRVAVAPAARGAGLAGLLLERALELAGDVDVVLDAQSHLVALYARHGFAVAGPGFVEDGIPHVPMLRRA
ncbi:GNAT family N-acetyltransferase [Kineococcus sp. NUM-3379]